MPLLMRDVMGGVSRKARVVTYSMYACVKDAVALRRGARCRAVRRGGGKDGVRPSEFKEVMSEGFFVKVVDVDKDGE